jgi:hypothetical protein
MLFPRRSKIKLSIYFATVRALVIFSLYGRRLASYFPSTTAFSAFSRRAESFPAARWSTPEHALGDK